MKRFPWMAMTLAAALLAAAFLLMERIPPPSREAAESGRAKGPAPETSLRPPAPIGSETQGGARKIAVIIDDIGYDRPMAKALAGLPAPVAFAILPFTPHAAEAAGELHAAGKEILLHLPMEPHSYPDDDPGQGALFTTMDGEAIRRHLTAALAEVPHAAGINNHMGSRFMEDEAALAVVMEALAGRGLFFIDSLTTPASRGREAAAKAGVRFAARSLFIDHPPHDGSVFERLMNLPRRGRGQTAPLLLIGHPYTETLQGLRAALPHWQKQGIEMIPVSAFLAERADRAPFNPGRKP